MSNKADSQGAPEIPSEGSQKNNPQGNQVNNDPIDPRTEGFADSAATGAFGQDPSNRDYMDGFLFDGPAGKGAGAGAPEGATGGSLEERVVDALRAIYDPEIPVNIYDLGLIYGVEPDANAHVTVTMTLTTPHCPVAEIMPGEVEHRVRAVQGVSGVTVNLVWDPPWDPSRMTEEAQLELGFI